MSTDKGLEKQRFNFTLLGPFALDGVGSEYIVFNRWHKKGME